MNDDEALRLAQLALKSTEEAEGNFPGGLIVTIAPNGDDQTAIITTNFHTFEKTNGAEDLVEKLKLILRLCAKDHHNPLEQYKYHEDHVYHLLAEYEDYD